MYLMYVLLILMSFSTWARETVVSDELTSDKNIEKTIESSYKKFKDLKEGANADYIPVLKKADSEQFGIALVTADGRVFEVGDIKKEFSIQSISKVFTLAEILLESGEQSVSDSVGVNATGDAFNSIIAIEKYKGHSMNPFVNPGAIAATSMVKGNTADEVWKKIMDIHSAFAGRQLSVLQDVYKSESDTNQRNQAISKLMFAYGIIKANPDQATDLYTRQCAIGVTAKDLAIMAATLANGGFNPVTKKQVIDQKHVKGILSVMATAGLYDTTGEWLFMTGLPAKSGVGGGVMAISPGKFGIAAFSPRLDKAGNSVRAQRAITLISEKLGGNPYDITPKTQSVVGQK
jgi:glutaminase